MPMTLKQDVHRAKQRDGTNKPIDLVHLSTQTLGDQALANEVLGIFAGQAKIYLNLLKAPKDEMTQKQTAHSLNGAARGIGAIRLSQLAQAVELGNADNVPQLLDELQRVNEYIATLK